MAASSASGAAASSAADGVAPVDAHLTRSIRFWMRAYPRRWRAARGQELLGLVLDLAGPDARHLGVRAAFDLLRGGWATRWREHPPLHTWLLYRTFDRRIPMAHRAWALDDIDGFWFPVRRYLGNSWFILFFPLIFRGPSQLPGWWWPAFVIVLPWLAIVRSEAQRREARLKHVAARPGDLVFAGALVGRDVPRPRVTAQSALRWSVPILGIVAAAAIASAVSGPKVVRIVPDPQIAASGEIIVAPIGGTRIVVVAVLVLALVAGLVGAVVTGRRLRHLLGHRLDQPNRLLRPVSRVGGSGAFFGVTLVVALAWAEVTGRLVVGLSVLVGVGALVLLPGALVALRVTRRVEVPELAGHDVWWIVARGRLPEVDRPVIGLQTLGDGYPDGVVVQPRRFIDPSYPALP